MNPFGAYASLTADQKRLLYAKSLEGRYEARELVTLLAPLGRFDASGGPLRKWLVAGAIVFAIGGFVATATAGRIGLVVWLASAACLFFYLRMRRIDLSDNLWSVAVPFLAVLREEMAPGATVDLKLDLTRPTEARKQTHTSEPYTQGSYTRIVDTVFHDPWFAGHAELADRSRLSWKIDDRVVVSKRRKRSSRGKTKFRTKHRKRSRLEVEIGLPGKEYDVSTQVPTLLGTNVQVESGQKRTSFRLVRVVKQPSLDPLDVRALLDLVAEAYKRAAPVAKGGAA